MHRTMHRRSNATDSGGNGRRSANRGETCPRRILVALIASTLILPGIEVEGRKCMCTSKACKEARVDTCRTKFSCYTELIMTIDQELNEDSITRGCTEGATPLLCETKSWVTRSKSPVRTPWPRLMCCDSHDYCNADRYVNVSTWIRGIETKTVVTGSQDLGGLTTDREGSLMVDSAFKNSVQSERDDSTGVVDQYRETIDQHFQHRVRPLHVAALVLAIAALISVLAACYVITRFLRSHPYVVNNDE